MSPIRTIDDLNNALDDTSSRRIMLKRLAALGLVAGGVAMSPLAAAAERRRENDRDEPKPKTRARRDRARERDEEPPDQATRERDAHQPDREARERNADARDNGARERDADSPDRGARERAADPAPESNDADRRRREPGTDAIIVGAPGMSSPHLHISSKNSAGNRTVMVHGSITFSQFDVNQMRLGLKYKISGRVKEEDDPNSFPFPDPDDDCFTFNQFRPYPGTFTSPTSSGGAFGAWSLSQSVPSSVLNDDNSWTNKQDEIYALVFLSASSNGGSSWTTLRTLRSNRVDIFA